MSSTLRIAVLDIIMIHRCAGLKNLLAPKVIRQNEFISLGTEWILSTVINEACECGEVESHKISNIAEAKISSSWLVHLNVSLLISIVPIRRTFLFVRF